MSNTCAATAGLLVTATLLGSFLHAQNIAVRPDYAPVAAALESQINREMVEKKLPAVAIAIVDDQKIVWAQGFGYEDEARTRLATAHTIFRIGSVSKLFTDIAVDADGGTWHPATDVPIQTYLPEFKPVNPFGTPITLRELMSHRAGTGARATRGPLLR